MISRAGIWGWVLAKQRPDKTNANNIKVANNVMQTLVENIKV